MSQPRTQRVRARVTLSDADTLSLGPGQVDERFVPPGVLSEQFALELDEHLEVVRVSGLDGRHA